MAADDIERLCRRIEDAPLELGEWPAVLDTLASALGGWGGHLIGFGEGGRFPLFITGGIAPEVPTDYEACGGADPASNPRAAAAWSAAPMQVVADPDFVSDEERRRNPIYREFLEPRDAHYVCAAVIEARPDLRIVAAVCHSKAQGPPQAWQRERLEALLPHLRSAALRQMKIEDDAAAIALGAFDSVGIAAILCDFAGRVVRLSRAAETILAEGRVLTQSAGLLRAVSPASDRALRTALERAASLASLTTAPRASALWLRDGMGLPVRVADVTPLPASSVNMRIGARLLVTVGVPTPRSKALLAELGLTRAEMDVALALVSGADVREIARRRDVSVETVRAQLKAVFAKMGVRRQGELFARLRDLI